MGRIEQILTDHFRKRTQMYVGHSDFASVALWIDGIVFAYERAFPDEVTDLWGFREWLLVHVGGSSTLNWPEIIKAQYGADMAATSKFFELFDRFRAAVRERGLDAVLQEHRDFEKT